MPDRIEDADVEQFTTSWVTVNHQSPNDRINLLIREITRTTRLTRQLVNLSILVLLIILLSCVCDMVHKEY